MILKAASGHDRDIAELERIAKDYPSCALDAQKEIANIRKGDHGEQNAAHFLDREYRDSKRTALLHDIRIECAVGDFAQIDHLLIHRIQGTAWILETKNYAGNLHCDEHGDWTVYYGKTPVSIPSPIEQARRQAIALERWLKERNIKGISRLVPVVLVNPRSHVNRKNLRDTDHVIKSDNFARWFSEQADTIGLGKALYMVATGMDEAKLREIGRRICEEDKPARFDWEARLGVKEKTPAYAASLSAEPVPIEPPPAPVAVQTDGATGNVMERIATPHGDITIKNIGTAYALRSPAHPDVIEAMKKACKGKGRWNPAYKNWLIPPEHIDSVPSELSSSFS